MILMEKDNWLIGATNIQEDFLQRFVEKYGWEKFEYGCKFVFDNVELILNVDKRPDVLYVVLKQTISSPPLLAGCYISLHGNDLNVFAKNLVEASQQMIPKIIAHCENSSILSSALIRFSEELRDTLKL